MRSGYYAYPVRVIEILEDSIKGKFGKGTYKIPFQDLSREPRC